MILNHAQLIQSITKIPDALIVESIDTVKCELVVTCHFGDSIDEGIMAAWRWFFHQEAFKKILIHGLNGSRVTFEREKE